MVQHPVVEGLEPDADILSIHLALSKSARHARILCQRPNPILGRKSGFVSDVRFRKTIRTRANAKAPLPNCADTLALCQVVSRTASNFGLPLGYGRSNRGAVDTLRRPPRQ